MPLIGRKQVPKEHYGSQFEWNSTLTTAGKLHIAEATVKSSCNPSASSHHSDARMVTVFVMVNIRRYADPSPVCVRRIVTAAIYGSQKYCFPVNPKQYSGSVSRIGLSDVARLTSYAIPEPVGCDRRKVPAGSNLQGSFSCSDRNPQEPGQVGQNEAALQAPMHRSGGMMRNPGLVVHSH